MVPNRVVRYFYYLGYALAQSELTQFSAFKVGLNYFYATYMLKQYYIKEPRRYPSVYGLN
jgi:hypothetical protein